MFEKSGASRRNNTLALGVIMSVIKVSCPHCQSHIVEKIIHKSTLHSVLKNGIFGTLTLKENASTKGTSSLENYCCTQCGVVFTPPIKLEQTDLIFN